jgi:hypothetical protein
LPALIYTGCCGLRFLTMRLAFTRAGAAAQHPIRAEGERHGLRVCIRAANEGSDDRNERLGPGLGVHVAVDQHAAKV